MYSGPCAGVRATLDPYDFDPGYLVDASNVYAPNPATKSGVYGRPQFRVLFDGSPIHGSGRGQCIYCHTMLDGTPINIIVVGGHVFRVSADLSTATDVTPVGVAIDASTTTRVFFASVAGSLMANDSINRPWVATNLTSTPITGTYIDYDGAGVTWTAYGAPRIFLGSAFVILGQVNGVSRRADISWSSPGDFTTGWQQANFDYNWTLSQNEAGLLYVLETDNVGLKYHRESSIGFATGQDITSLASTATDDALAFNIGSQCPQSIVKFGGGYFFIDSQGRPYFSEPGKAPDPIWKQMQQFVDAGTTNNPTTTSVVCTAALEPDLNLFLVAIWSPVPSTIAPPVDIHVFDANTRIYQGRWSISTGLSVECLGTLLDDAGRPTLIAVTSGGLVWAFSGLGIPVEDLTTEGGFDLTTEDARLLTTEGAPISWEDDVAAQDTYVLTDRLGFQEDTVWNVDMATVITSTEIPITVSVVTANSALTAQGTPTPMPSQTQSYRTVVGCDAFGRGPQVKIAPANHSAQFIFQRVSIKATPSLAGPEDA